MCFGAYTVSCVCDRTGDGQTADTRAASEEESQQRKCKALGGLRRPVPSRVGRVRVIQWFLQGHIVTGSRRYGRQEHLVDLNVRSKA